MPAPRPEPGWTEQTDVGYELPTPKEPVLDADPVWTAVPAAVGTEPVLDPEARAPLPAQALPATPVPVPVPSAPAPAVQADSVAEPVLDEEAPAATVRPAPKDEPDWVAALEFPEPAPVPDLPSLLSQQRRTEAGQAAPADPLDAALAPPPEVAASSGSSSVDDDLPAAAAATRAPTVSTPVVEAAHAHDDEDDNDTAAQARAGDDGAATPSFVRQAQRQARWRKPWVRAILAAAAVVLPLLLLGQVALHERNALAASAPAVRPALTALCQVLGCSIEPPRDIAMVVIAGTSFTEDGRPGRYRLGVSVRNQARTPVATPALELTLTDASDQPLARRVFLPQELSAPQALGPRAEWNGSFPVQVQELPQPVVGYRAQLFYP